MFVVFPNYLHGYLSYFLLLDFPACQNCSMKTIAIISQKGGTGKTTLAVSLATAALKAGQVAIIADIDQQASSATWANIRKSKHPELTRPMVKYVPPSLISDVVSAAEKGSADYLIIDTAPHSEGGALDAAKLADIVIITCRPGILDLMAIKNSHQIAKFAETNAICVLTFARTGAKANFEANNILNKSGLEVAPVTIGQRVAYSHAITNGLGVVEFQPKSEASKEVQKLFKFIDRAINQQSNQKDHISA